MTLLRSEVIELASEMDMLKARQAVRACALELGFKLIDQTKIVTAASELARNTLIHGKGGHMRLEVLHNGLKKGMRLVFEDKGPGIPDVDRALQDGYTTGNGMGMGLGGSRRLVNDFQIETKVGEGTRITIAKWI